VSTVLGHDESPGSRPAAALAEMGRRAVSHAAEEAERAGVRTVVEVLPQKPAQPLVDAVLGSVSHELLHLSDRPVRCVPAGDEAPDPASPTILRVPCGCGVGALR
jgi:hypothetical protein